MRQQAAPRAAGWLSAGRRHHPREPPPAGRGAGARRGRATPGHGRSPRRLAVGSLARPRTARASRLGCV